MSYSSYVIVVTTDGRGGNYLLCVKDLSKKHTTGELYFELPGGREEPGDGGHPRQTMLREIGEKIGGDLRNAIRNPDFLGRQARTRRNRDHDVYYFATSLPFKLLSEKMMDKGHGSYIRRKHIVSCLAPIPVDPKLFSIKHLEDIRTVAPALARDLFS